MATYITDPRRWLAADQDGDGPHGDRIGWSDAGQHVTHSRRRQALDQHRRATGAGNRAANMRHYTGYHRANMHVGQAGGWQSHI